MGLEYIYTDANYNELGYLAHTDADIEIGEYGVSKNDFELTLSLEDRDQIVYNWISFTKKILKLVEQSSV